MMCLLERRTLVMSIHSSDARTCCDCLRHDQSLNGMSEPRLRSECQQLEIMSESARPSFEYQYPMSEKAPIEFSVERLKVEPIPLTIDEIEEFVAATEGIDPKRKAKMYLEKLFSGLPQKINGLTIPLELREKANCDEMVLSFSTFCLRSMKYASLFSEQYERVQHEWNSQLPVYTLRFDAYTAWDAVHEWCQYRSSVIDGVSQLDNGWYRHGIKLLSRYQYYRLIGTQPWWRDAAVASGLGSSIQPSKPMSEIVSGKAPLPVPAPSAPTNSGPYSTNSPVPVPVASSSRQRKLNVISSTVNKKARTSRTSRPAVPTLVTIYKLVYLPENRAVYTGKSSNLSRRLQAHSYASSNCRLVRNAMSHYGCSKFRIEPLVRCRPEDADANENYYIMANGTMYPEGYNLRHSQVAGEPCMEERRLVTASSGTVAFQGITDELRAHSDAYADLENICGDLEHCLAGDDVCRKLLLQVHPDRAGGRTYTATEVAVMLNQIREALQ